MAIQTLTPTHLHRPCDPATLGFTTTADVAPLDEFIGQPRAMAALAFGAGIPEHGFNLFAVGLPDSGKSTLIQHFLLARAANDPVPNDLCYVHNFTNPTTPVILQLPPGMGVILRNDMARLIRALREALPQAFESPEYQQQRQAITTAAEQAKARHFAQMEAMLKERGFIPLKAASGVIIVPARDGHPMTPDEVAKLSEAEQQRLIQHRQSIEADIEKVLRTVHDLDEDAQNKLNQLNEAIARAASEHHLAALRRRYDNLPDVLAYLDAVLADVLANLETFTADSHEPSSNAPAGLPIALPTDPFLRYTVNVFVDNSTLKGAPVIFERNPAHPNLIGRIEHQAILNGVVLTNFTLLKPGALHKANGGYLILPVRECLFNPFAWDSLKRALKERAVRIEEMGAQYGILTPATLHPEPAPLNVKVVLVGSPQLFHLLQAYDEDFPTLFKVKADFATDMPRSPESELAYARFVRGVTDAMGVAGRPFEPAAVARLVEYGARLAGHQHRLSTRFGELADTIREAAYHAHLANQPHVTDQHVTATITARRFRNNLTEDTLHRLIAERTLLIDTQGQAVGRINGLAVLDTGDHTFGQPSRISATVSPGYQGVASIEREVHLSGPIHGKAILIIRGYLNRQYAANHPLALNASIVFEQSYGLIEGDSASLAELIALLSAISGLPVRQDLAITGSMNQHGHAQPIGGINEKIEGFYAVCARTGALTGTQGVVFPSANLPHLMLTSDIIAAVTRGQFHLYAVDTIDDALTLLLDRPADTIHRRVASRLADYAATLTPKPRSG